VWSLETATAIERCFQQTSQAERYAAAARIVEGHLAPDANAPALIAPKLKTRAVDALAALVGGARTDSGVVTEYEAELNDSLRAVRLALRAQLLGPFREHVRTPAYRAATALMRDNSLATLDMTTWVHAAAGAGLFRGWLASLRAEENLQVA